MGLHAESVSAPADYNYWYNRKLICARRLPLTLLPSFTSMPLLQSPQLLCTLNSQAHLSPPPPLPLQPPSIFPLCCISFPPSSLITFRSHFYVNGHLHVSIQKRARNVLGIHTAIILKLPDRCKSITVRDKNLCAKQKQLISPVFHSAKWHNNTVLPYVWLNKQSDERMIKHQATHQLICSAIMKHVPICLSLALSGAFRVRSCVVGVRSCFPHTSHKQDLNEFVP